MNLTDAIKMLCDDLIIPAIQDRHSKPSYASYYANECARSIEKEHIRVAIASRLDELTGHSKLLEACKRARREIDNAVRLRLSCEQWDTSYLTAAIADAEKE